MSRLLKIAAEAGRKRSALPVLAAAVAGLAALVLPGAASAQQDRAFGGAIELVDPDVLRVCADPSNLPFSNEAGEGFENKLAEFLAPKLGRKRVEYTFFPQATGFVRMTLGSRRCDVIMSYPQGDELVQNTNAYYRTAYTLVVPKGGALDGVEAIEDPLLKDKRIGVVAGTPPASYMARAGLMAKAKPYPLLVDTRIDNSARQMIADLKAGTIDAAILWGPLAAWYTAKAGGDFTLTPLVKEPRGPTMVFRITMGVRPSDQEWKRTLNTVIRENQAAIDAILLDYGMPLLDEQDHPITTAGGTSK
ncbi:substrate-binding domain-containing protein [Mangrovibrevibacter kandeliae]|uniref:substrate-binding domain-containing protein n=1 Tax=Mangrovibrevibacter kandeliae TaxID=2968473 RepID=UPI00389ABCB3